MKNLILQFTKLNKYILFLAISPIFVTLSLPLYASPPDTSGPNVIRGETPAWWIYSNEEFVVVHGNNLIEACNNQVFFFPAGMWDFQLVRNPHSVTGPIEESLSHGKLKAGEDVETWIYPSEYFFDEDGNPVDPFQVCINLWFNSPDPEIAKGMVNILHRTNNAFGVETNRATTQMLSAHGVLSSPEGEEMLFTGGFHCVYKDDPTMPKCKNRIKLH